MSAEVSPHLSEAGAPAVAATHGALPRAWRTMLDRHALALALGVWGAFFLIRTSLFMLTPEHVSDWRALSARALASACGALICLSIHALLRRRAHDPWRRLLWVLMLAIPGAALLDLTGFAIWRLTSDYFVHNPERWLNLRDLIEDFLTYLWVFLAWGALYSGAATAIEVRRRDQALAAAETAAQEAQLLALRLQIHPHFLFNTLNTLAGLIALGRNAESERMALTLSRFLRHTLANRPSQCVLLTDELRAVHDYLDIEIARFPDRLQVRFPVDSACERALVPSLILLPLVENAIKYGLAETEDGISLEIGAARDGDALVLWVEDDGSGLPCGQEGLGIGLRNVRQRLSALYGDAAQLLSGTLGRGWRSAIRIPWQEATKQVV